MTCPSTRAAPLTRERALEITAWAFDMFEREIAARIEASHGCDMGQLLRAAHRETLSDVRALRGMLVTRLEES